MEAAAGGAGAGSATGSPSDMITRSHRMTLAEAKMILNLQEDISLDAARRTGGIADKVREELAARYEKLFEINAPPAPKGKTGGGSGSFYVQSKIVRARERIEAEWDLLKPSSEA